MSSLIQRTTARNRRVTGHIFGRDELDWHGNVLQLGQRKLAQIEPDAVWPSMWRVRTPDGRLSEMVNISRARDAARARPAAPTKQETPAGAPPIARNKPPSPCTRRQGPSPDDSGSHDRGGGGVMSRAPPTFRKRDVRAAVAAVVAAGVEVASVELDKDGKITVIAGKPCNDQHGNPWDAAVRKLENER